MPIYFGHTNTKGLEISPLLKVKGINLLRASPHNVRAVARPLVKQPGYSSYVSFLPAFMKACLAGTVVPLDKSGYVAEYPADQCIELINPSLVVDYNGPIPAKHVDTLNTVGFERIKMNKRENIVRFPIVSLTEVREIMKTAPNSTTPAPANTVNLEAFQSWVLFLRLLSNLLKTHMYPAFRDNEHYQSEVNDIIDMVTLKRRAAESMTSRRAKRTKTADGDNIEDMAVDDEEEGEIEETGDTSDIQLSKAKPISSSESAWGNVDTLPNCSGLFFPYIAELASQDTETVPAFIEQYLFQSLGDVPEKQLERMENLRRAWGIIGKTESGNVSSHLCKVFDLALQSQARVYPIIQNQVYEGCVLLGARLFVGVSGVVYRPQTFDKLQAELGGYSTHARTLSEIADVCGITHHWMTTNMTTMRKLRNTLLGRNLNEEKRDTIRKIAMHLHFKERFLAVNSGTLSQLIDELANPEESNDDLPLHHSAIFSNDPVLVALSAFGFQAPSFDIQNCPKLELKGTPPQVLVMRQKPLDLACQDWKSVLETREIRNNPRNLSRANRDRSLVGNDKTVIWGKLVNLRKTGGEEAVNESGGVFVVDTGDHLDDW